jgi:AcrR family transcriptional regulator
MQQVSAAPSAAEPQRRERKKRQTRDALVHAALALFIAKGYEQTAVREITDAVDVSERTFFRYFANKEDLALSFAKDHTDALMRELNARPPQEPPLVALRNALHASITRLVEEAGDPAGDSVYLSIMKLIEGTPSLLAAHLRYMHERDDEIARVLAEREGVDPIADLRPRCVAAVFSGLFITANREWRYAGGTVEAMLATFDACADQVAAALAGHWRLSADGVYAGLVRVGCGGAAPGPAAAAAPRVHGPGGRRGGGRHPGRQRGRVRRDQVRPAPARGPAGPP